MHVVVMGVSGSGKSTVGEALARRLGVQFLDGDDLHPEANKRKMAGGVPLTDDDRWPWLDAVGRALENAPDGMVMACSALRRAYRDRIRSIDADAVFVLLDAPPGVFEDRLQARRGHFMPASLLASQLATLERPAPDERAIVADVTPGVDAVVAAIVVALPGATGA